MPSSLSPILRYHSSLDTVRFNPLHPYSASALHAEVEMSMTMLAGQQIVISEPMAFDSAGLLRLIPPLLSPHHRNDRCPEELLATSLKFPLVIALRNLKGGRRGSRFRDAIAANFEMIHPSRKEVESGAKPGIILSAWEKIDGNPGLRRELAACLKKSKQYPSQWAHGAKLISKEFDPETVEAYEAQWHALRLLSDYADAPGAKVLIQAHKPQMPLDQYHTDNGLLGLRQQVLQTSNDQLKELYMGLLKTAESLQSMNVPVTNRSMLRRILSAYKGDEAADVEAIVTHLERQKITSELLNSFIAFTDVAYNQVIGECSTAKARMLTGQPASIFSSDKEICQLLAAAARSHYGLSAQHEPLPATDISFRIEAEQNLGNTLNLSDLKLYKHMFPLQSVIKALHNNMNWNWRIREELSGRLSDTKRLTHREERWKEMSRAVKDLSLETHEGSLVMKVVKKTAGIVVDYVLEAIKVLGPFVSDPLNKFVEKGLKWPYAAAAAGYTQHIKNLYG